MLEKSGVDPGDVKGLGITGQMHGLVLLDENGEPLRRSILWCDRPHPARNATRSPQAVGEKRLIEIAANPALTGFTAGKILWVRRHQPELFATRAARRCCPRTTCATRLTGELAHGGSATPAARNLLDVPGAPLVG